MNLTERYENLVGEYLQREASAKGLITEGYAVGYGMIPSPSGPSFGMSVLLVVKGPLIGQKLSHVMVVNATVPSPFEVENAVKNGVLELDKAYQEEKSKGVTA